MYPNFELAASYSVVFKLWRFEMEGNTSLANLQPTVCIKRPDTQVASSPRSHGFTLQTACAAPLNSFMTE
jgi:hypothetical protein